MSWQVSVQHKKKHSANPSGVQIVQVAIRVVRQQAQPDLDLMVVRIYWRQFGQVSSAGERPGNGSAAGLGECTITVVVGGTLGETARPLVPAA
jgi:hypothetical protein